MKRQILAFALSLLALCGVLTAARLAVGVDYSRLSTVVHLPIVWAMTIAELAIGLLCFWRAWQVVAAYNGGGIRQSPKAFPDLSRANGFAFVAIGSACIGDAVCHWLPAYWSLLGVKAIAVAVLAWSVVVWGRGIPGLREWFGLLQEAEGGDGERS